MLYPDQEPSHQVDYAEDIEIKGNVETMTIPKKGNSSAAVVRNDFDKVGAKATWWCRLYYVLYSLEFQVPFRICLCKLCVVKAGYFLYLNQY